MKRVKEALSKIPLRGPEGWVFVISLILVHVVGYSIQSAQMHRVRKLVEPRLDSIVSAYSEIEGPKPLRAQIATEKDGASTTIGIDLAIEPAREGAEGEVPIPLVENVGVRSYLASGLRVVGTWELVARGAEFLISSNTGEGRIKLCRGTRSQPKTPVCKASELLAAESQDRGASVVEGPGSASGEDRSSRAEAVIGPALLRLRFLSLMLGPIQYWCIGLGLFCWVMAVHKRSVFGAPRARPLSLQDFTSQKSIDAPLPGVQLRLYQQVLRSLQRLGGAGGARGVAALEEVQRSALDRINQEKNRFDDQLLVYRSTAEVIGSLAFLGTIVGIILAMFELVASQTALPMEAEQARLRLYNSMGLAFGTTAVGLTVSTSIVAYLDSIQAAQRKFMNRVFESITSFLAEWKPGAELALPQVRAKSSLVDRIFVVVALLIILSMLVLFWRSGG